MEPPAGSPVPQVPSNQEPLACSPDHYHQSEDFSGLLSLATRVKLNHPERLGGKAEVSIGELILAAGCHDLAKAREAQGALRHFLKEEIAQRAAEAQAQSFSDPDENLINALALLSTPGNSPEAVQARKDGVTLLRQHLEASDYDRDLLRGIMVAVATLDNDESLKFAARLAQEHPQVFRQIHELPNRAKVQEALAEIRIEEGSSPAPRPLQGGTAGAELQGVTAKTLSSNISFSGAPVPGHEIPHPILDLVQNTLQNILPPHSDVEHFLGSGPGKKLSVRLAEIANHPELSPEQLKETLRIAVLSRGFHHPWVSSTQDQYNEIRPYAAAIAERIYQQVQNPEGLVSSAPLNSEAFPGPSPAMDLEDISSGQSLSSRPVAQGRAALSRDLQSSLKFFSGASQGSTAFPGTQVTSSTVAAGMMGINFLALAGGAPFSFAAANSSSRPSYFIDGVSSAEADTHSGSQEDASEQDQGHSGQDQSSQSEAFLA